MCTNIHNPAYFKFPHDFIYHLQLTLIWHLP